MKSLNAACGAFSLEVINHTAFDVVLNAIQRSHESAFGDERPVNLRLDGVSGVGKSTLLEGYAKLFPAERTNAGTRVRVVYVKVPSKPTLKALYTALLRALGAPMPEQGTTSNQYFRFITLATACGVELIMIDEAHHFVERGSYRTYGPVADALKLIVDELKVPAVVSGAPRLSILFRANMQLRSRFLRSIRLRPFNVDSAENLANLIGFVSAFKNHFPADAQPFLASPEFCIRMFFASDGVARQIVDLMRRLKELIVVNGFLPSLQTAEQAFKDVIWLDVEDQKNPFNELFIERRLNLTGEPYEPSELDGDNHGDFL